MIFAPTERCNAYCRAGSEPILRGYLKSRHLTPRASLESLRDVIVVFRIDRSFKLKLFKKKKLFKNEN